MDATVGGLQCQFCKWHLRSPKLEKLIAYYLIHSIDDHWDLLEQIRATTRNPAGRQALVEQLRRQYGESSLS